MSPRYDLPWRAAQTPDAPALETAAGTWTFAELLDRARRGAAYVQAAAQRDTPIGLLLEGSAGFAAWFHAIVLAGRTVLPLNLRLTAGELAQQLADARVGCLLGEAGDARLADLAARVPGLRVAIAPRISWPAPKRPRTASDPWSASAGSLACHCSMSADCPC